ncbi:hypothetical protein FQN50_005112 [Emmonsiellopsis sp. PD_5]|nr:hypothetical protein FQN50_005112 [Emmonsiellopsis sp. PD_5]
MACLRRWVVTLIFSFVFLLALYHLHHIPAAPIATPPTRGYVHKWWKLHVIKNTVTSMIPLPTNQPAPIPKIQFNFPPEDPDSREIRQNRQNAVKESFLHTWKGYKTNAWLQDELGPINGERKSTFGGWGATLVDSLDTLWLMGLKDEFEEAVAAIKDIDFSTSDTLTLNVFETTIRYLGGFLAAHDLTGGAYPILLKKAVELADMLYVAFDTPNRMPVLRWYWPAARDGEDQESSGLNIVAELGSLSVEFTRLTQITKDPKYFDAIQRITDMLHEHQHNTRLPGLWPLAVDTNTPAFNGDRRFTFGGMADSLYEYLPKEYLMLGGRSQQYKEMYEAAIEVAKKNLFFRPMTKNNDDILLSGQSYISGKSMAILKPEGQHLTCFVGGMVALGAKVFNRPEEIEIARKLTEGCIWAYKSMPSGIMPESFRAVACEDTTDCTWQPHLWFVNEIHDDATPADFERMGKEQGKIPGFAEIGDRRYSLRPEAIESVFTLYRITGDQTLQDKGWDMFIAIEGHARTNLAYGAVADVTSRNPGVLNEMESFWTGETLKYFYLLFSETGLSSLDEWVFNTEAHPLKRV